MKTLHFCCAALLLCGCDVLGEDYAPIYDGDENFVGSQSTLEVSTSDSEPIVVSVPEGARSFAVVLSDLGSTKAQPATITNPDGEVVFEAGMNRTNRADAYPYVSTALVPVNTAVDVMPGDWEIVWFGDGTASATVDTVIKLGAGSQLNLNVHFVSLESLDATALDTDGPLPNIFDSVESTLGFTLDTQAYDVDAPEFAVLETTQNGSGELLELFETHSADRADNGRSLNIFLVADLENPDSARSLLGVAGGVPGPPGIHGTERSGVAINMANFLAAMESGEGMAEAQAELELVIAHEIGHYLGLFHTTEANGEALEGGLNGADPLASTPVCPDSADMDGDGVLSSDECSAHDGNNLMFWSPPNGATELNGDQSTIINVNPVVR